MMTGQLIAMITVFSYFGLKCHSVLIILGDVMMFTLLECWLLHTHWLQETMALLWLLLALCTPITIYGLPRLLSFWCD